MKYIARAYQRVATLFLLKTKRCCLFLQMGLGKTVATLTAMVILKLLGELDKVLVVAPIRVARSTWPNEIKKWNHTRSDLTYSVVKGTPKQRIAALMVESDIYLINYENVKWLVDFYKSRWPFRIVILDESTKIKNPSSKRFRALRRILPKTLRWANLTGTPMPNGLLNLWSQLYCLDRGERLCKSFGAYRDKYFISDYNGYNWTPKEDSQIKIHDAINDVCLSMKTKDYLDLPPLVVNPVYVDIPTSLMKRYRTLEKDMYLQLSRASSVTASTAAALSMKCRQFANGILHTDEKNWIQVHDLKIDAVKDIVEDAQGAQVLISYVFKEDLIRLRRAFPEAVLVSETDDFETLWNDKKVGVGILYGSSDAHGLNLQHGGNIGVWLGMTWDLEAWDQFPERLHRSGQQADFVVMHVVMARDTIEPNIMMPRIKSKITPQESLMNAMRKAA